MGDFRTAAWPNSQNQELRARQRRDDAAAAEVQIALHNLEPAYKQLVLRSHRRRDVIRVEVLCGNYPGAEN